MGLRSRRRAPVLGWKRHPLQLQHVLWTHRQNEVHSHRPRTVIYKILFWMSLLFRNDGLPHVAGHHSCG